jgi:hypothetical protein
MTIVYEEIIDFIAAGPTSEDVASWHPSEKASARVSELIERERTSGLSSEEKSELGHYAELEHLMRLAKARAHKVLRGK